MTQRGGVRLALGVACLIGGAAALRFFLSLDALPDDFVNAGRSERISRDLLGDVARARVVRDTRSIAFGAADARRHYHEPDPRNHGYATGILSRDVGDGRSIGFAIGKSVTVRFDRLSEGDAAARLVALAPDSRKSQRVSLAMAGAAEPFAEIEIPPGIEPRSLPFTIPGDQLRRGGNQLELRFATTVKRPFEGWTGELEVGAGLLALEFATTAPKTEGREPRREDVAGVAELPDRTALVFHEGGRLEIPLVLERGAPRFEGAIYVHPDDSRPGGAVDVIARLRGIPAGTMLLGKARLDASRAAPRDRQALRFDVDLSAFAGGPVRLEFETSPPRDGAAPLRLALAAPTIRGGAPWPKLDRAPDLGLAKLRESLAGSNVVVLLLDAAAARHFSAYGATREVAPNIALLARDAIVFDQVTAPASYTLASIGSLCTGQLPDRHGVVDGGTDRRRLPATSATFAERLRAAGYATLGLVSNPNAGPEFGFDRGFDTYETLYAEKELWDEGVAPEALVARALARADEGKLREPYYLYAHFFPPHAPYDPPAEFLEGLVDEDFRGDVDGTRATIERVRQGGERFSRGEFDHLRDLYDANIKYVDSQVRALLEGLAARGLLDRTIIAIVADHGEAFFQHQNLEHGDTAFSEEVEVPWIMALPRHLEHPPTLVKGPCSLLDFAPTLLSLLSLPLPLSNFDGIDLVPRLFEREVPIDPSPRPLVQRSAGFAPRFAIRMFGHAYHEDLYTRERWLFDLERDPHEQQPLPVASSPLADVLRSELCRTLCEIERGKGAAVKLTPEQERMMAEIGYLESTGPSRGVSPQTCPFAGG
jgi:arylsulfatase A-like enzyme